MINRNYFARLRNVLLIQTILVFCVSAVFAQQKQLPQPSTMVVAPRSNVDTLAEIKKSGKLRVGVAKIAPWAFHDKNDKTKYYLREYGWAISVLSSKHAKSS